jgi:hypothetical protein
MRRACLIGLLLLAACGTANDTGSDAGNNNSSCTLVGTWHVSGTSATPNFTFVTAGTFVGNITANNEVSGTWSLTGNNGVFTNTAKGANSDPTFDACIGVVGKYTLSFATDCNSYTWALVSDTCAGRLQLQSATFVNH